MFTVAYCICDKSSKIFKMKAFISIESISSGGATPGRARWLEDPPPCLPLCPLLCFASAIVWTGNKNFTYIWLLTALFVLFWQWINFRGVGLCVLRATTKKGRQLFRGKSASGWPGSRMFWPRNDLARLLRWLRHWIILIRCIAVNCRSLLCNFLQNRTIVCTCMF